jgi:hypothetical protein
MKMMIIWNYFIKFNVILINRHDEQNSNRNYQNIYIWNFHDQQPAKENKNIIRGSYIRPIIYKIFTYEKKSPGNPESKKRRAC